MTTTPRPTAPRAAALFSSVALHAALLAAAAVIPTSLVAAADAPPADERETVLAWIVPQSRPEVVVVSAPARVPESVPAARRDVGRLEMVVLEEPVTPPHVETRASDAGESMSPRPSPPTTAPYRPGRGGARSGPGGAGGGIGVGSGGGRGEGGTGTGAGSGTGWGQGDDGDGAGFARIGGSTRGPAITSALTAPPYPRTARSRGWQGRVLLVLAIGADGRVTSVEIAESSGHEDLDDAARAAASDWTFAPALEDGEPVAGTLRVPVRFELTD